MNANFTHTLKPISQAIGLRDYVASQLIQSIFHGQLKEGDRLIVQTMAASMQVSATPIREALVQLNEIGLVQQIPNKGAVCCAFGAQQVKEFFQIRRILEVEAVRISVYLLPAWVSNSMEPSFKVLLITGLPSMVTLTFVLGLIRHRPPFLDNTSTALI